MTYLVAKALSDAFDALENLDAAPIAGGTDWFPSQGERMTGRSLLDVTRLPDFRGISQTVERLAHRRRDALERHRPRRRCRPLSMV